jgi:CheY-like chemotaxis protein
VAVADRTQLESALLNLSVNARDAMQDGGTLTIATSEVAAPSGEAEYVQIKVTDTGTGIPPEALEHVFEPFFTTKEVGKGTGLGLAMVYGFAQQSGGHVHIESKVGEGTSVTIVLPAAKDLRRSDRTSVSGPAPLPGGTETVLVVEDSAGVRRYATSTLLSLGYQVLEAPDGEAALEILRENDTVRLLFTDVVLPKGIDGVELARRAQAMRPGLKVLLTSGYSEDVFRRQGRPGADAPLIQKPYRRAALADAIRDVLGGKEAGERPPISREMRMAEPHVG